ncbi:heme-binding domain-containing protein [uncultured Chryseobacterium sp.]|uniref:heme-binding domain-containing protein n=1 Tax=uncultured Chryseobacterium sp. TaxID=259322 RepID=UPI0025EAC555|nr:heme-binding domain-containing protein [uncultured Chryseobacterium sp.]
MKTAKKVLFWSLIVFVVIQFIPVNRVNPPVKKAENFVEVKNTPDKIRVLLKNACYDCHSNETVYPKYAFIAPVSWSVKSHIDEGREHLNFSVWETYNKDLKKSMLSHSIQTLQNRTMPMPGYIVYHPEANLSEAERTLLEQYFENMLTTGSY